MSSLNINIVLVPAGGPKFFARSRRTSPEPIVLPNIRSKYVLGDEHVELLGLDTIYLEKLGYLRNDDLDSLFLNCYPAQFLT